MSAMRLTLWYGMAHVTVGMIRFWTLSLNVDGSTHSPQTVADAATRTLGLSLEAALAIVALGLIFLVCCAIVYSSERFPRATGRTLRGRPWTTFVVVAPYFFLLVQIVSSLIDILAATTLVRTLVPETGFITANAFLLSGILFALLAMLLGPKTMSVLLKRYPDT
jgi:hypothetical protein